MARRSRRRRSLKPLLSVLVLLLLLPAMWWLHNAFPRRNWNEFTDAGTRAMERGNHDWAEKMYREALQYAQRHGSRDNEARSYVNLYRLYVAMEDTARAAEMRARALEARNAGR